MTNTPTHVCAKTALLVDLRQKVGKLVLCITFLCFSHYFRKYFKLVYRKNVVIVTLTTGIMFIQFACMHFGHGEFYEGGSRVRRPPVKSSPIAESLRNIVL
jgi:hypothetical protein